MIIFFQTKRKIKIKGVEKLTDALLFEIGLDAAYALCPEYCEA